MTLKDGWCINCVRFLSVAIGLLHLTVDVLAVDQASPDADFTPTRSPAYPTRRPTRRPSRLATDQPVVAPVVDDTFSPSTAPASPKPTDTPTWDPSPTPSLMPSFSRLEPTPIPTRRPTTRRPITAQPVVAPIADWTFDPTIGPTRDATAEPTAEPTLEETLDPTVEITDMPTLEESNSPSYIEVFPTADPTPSPTSREPTDRPTSAPTMDSMVYQDLTELVMYMNHASELDSSSVITLQRITGGFIANEFNSLYKLNITDLVVGTSIISQQQVHDLPSTGRLRKLDESAKYLEIFLNAKVSFRSPVDNIDVSDTVDSAFDSEDDLARYLEELQSSGDLAFSNVNSIQVLVDGERQDVAASVPPEGGVSTTTWFIIIGSAAGGLCFLVITMLYCRMTGTRKPVAVVSMINYGNPVMGGRVGADIVMDNQDDISTLGDPMYSPGGMMMGGGLDRDETVATSIVSGDWDYARNYGVTAGRETRARSDTLHSSQNGSYADLSSFGGLTKMDNSILSDDMSFEQQFVEVEERFEVDAPAGKLGMVIDTPSGGMPLVHAIKTSSILADRVEVGDRLISVDDEDTTGLTAMQVSKMISQKAQNPSRILVFARTRARAMSADGVPQ